jgi:hypothetical protein
LASGVVDDGGPQPTTSANTAAALAIDSVYQTVYGRHVLAELAPIIEEQVARVDTGHDVFHGCIDWHSAVHGHWALLRIANVTGDAALGARVDTRLDAVRIAKERALLEQEPEFEMPYGRAWFLRLVIEHARWGEGLRAMATMVAASLRAHYAARPPSSSSREYANASWAFAQLHAWYAHTGDAAGLAYVRAELDTHLAVPPAQTFAADATLEQFFSPTGNWLYLIATARPERLADAIARVELGSLEPNRALPRTAHGLGLNWSRAWCLAKLASVLGEPRYRVAFDAHVEAATEHHRMKAADVWAYRHWVPQFAVYALTT